MLLKRDILLGRHIRRENIYKKRNIYGKETWKKNTHIYDQRIEGLGSIIALFLVESAGYQNLKNRKIMTKPQKIYKIEKFIKL